MQWIKKFETNTEGRDFVVGDLHGHIDELNLLLNRVSFDKTKDRLFSVGDLADRGPKSLETMQLIYEPWFFAVRGNHEDMLCSSYGLSLYKMPYDIGHSMHMHRTNGGHWATLAEHEFGLSFMKNLVQDITDKLPLVLVVGEGEHRFNVVHAELHGPEAGLLTNKMLDDMAKTGQSIYTDWDKFDEKCMWARNLVKGHGAKNIGFDMAPTYSGHSIITNAPKRIHHQILIDSGCYEDRSLTLVEPKTGQFWSVNKFSY